MKLLLSVTKASQGFLGLLLAAAIVSFGVANHQTAHANEAALRILPLTYQETLAKGEIKKGHVDVVNPTDKTVSLTTDILAFRQTDDRGSLEFYESEQITQAIKPDLDSFKLGPNQAMRLYFEVNGQKLPTGDVFAAIFVQSTQDSSRQLGQTLRVGTLLVLENTTPGARQAAVTYVEAPFWQAKSQLTGSYRIKNQAKAGEVTGFSPEVTISLTPFGGQYDHRSSLVFAGRERGKEFSFETNRAGLYYLEVSYEDSKQGRWVLLFPQWAMIASVVLVVTGVVIWLVRSRSRKIYKKP